MSAAKMKFEAANGAFVHLRNRMRGDAHDEEAGQSMGFSDGDQFYAYDTALTRDTYSMQIDEITDDERAAFQTWFDDDLQGVFGVFTLTIPPHPRGSGYPRVIANARFSSPALRWTSVDEAPGGERHTLRLDFFTEEEGPTGPPT